MFFMKDPLPANWPSAWHNKCNNSKCTYPNNPQPAPGRYNCGGCKKGTYVVTLKVAKEVDAAQQQQRAFLEQKCREEAAHQQRALLEQQRREEERERLEQQRRDDAASQQRSRKKIARQNRALEAQRTHEEVTEMGQSMWADYERRFQVQRTLEQGSQGPSLYEQTSPRTDARRAKLAERPDASSSRQGAYHRQYSAGESSHGHGVSRAASPAQGGYACVQPRTAYYPHSVGGERPVFF